MKKHYNVVAAVIHNDERKYMCTKRNTSSNQEVSEKWEFPGGKVEVGESEEEALTREIKEELGCQIKVDNHIITTHYEYTTVDINLAAYHCKINSGQPQLLEHKDIKWLKATELDKLEWAPADIEIVEAIKKEEGVIDSGLYEGLITTAVEEKIHHLNHNNYYIANRQLKSHDAVRLLTTHFSRFLDTILKMIRSDSDSKKKVQLINRLMLFIAQEVDKANLEDYSRESLVTTGDKILSAVIDRTILDRPDLEKHLEDIRPETTLTHSALFTGGRSSVNMVSELRKEILTSDEICLLISFIKKSGLNLIYEQLKEFTKNNTHKLRILTTTYTQATDYDAIIKLAKLPNTEIKISYDNDTDRLHAKTYYFKRKTGYNVAYIGSSNLSYPALTSGMEWNVKVTREELPHIIHNVDREFNAYCHNEHFQTFKLNRDEQTLQIALGIIPPKIKLDTYIPRDYQQEVLDKLTAERKLHHSTKNLIVAATGTGKTVISAFDFRRYTQQHNNKNIHLLYVAHRKEILDQGLRTFRSVMQDSNFGQVWYGGEEITSYETLFASKDILNTRIPKLHLPRDYYDYIIIDEAHHAAAETFTKIIKFFEPQILLGLTATPERMDGQNILKYFNNRIAADIRLASALNNRLLSPFSYFGIYDETDLSDIRWTRGGYKTADLSKIYTHNDHRFNIVMRAINNYVDDPEHCRAVGFCVSIEHAEYMYHATCTKGLKAAYLTGNDEKKTRQRILQQFKDGEINYLYVVDLLNEGIDIPAIDTVMFLRPTESLTIFLQQLGRGLRKTEGKERLTVLDFVGNQNKEFDYSDRFRAMLGPTSMNVSEELKKGCPHLPFGCQITLEPVAEELVIKNIEQNISRFNKTGIINKITNFHNSFGQQLTLESFIRLTKTPFKNLFASGRTWRMYQNWAGIDIPMSEYENELSKAVYSKWLSTDSHTYFTFIKQLAQTNFNIQEATLSEQEKRMATMLYYDFYESEGKFQTLNEMFLHFAADQHLSEEILEIIDILINNCQNLESPDNSPFTLINPLQLHGIYTRSQILCGLGLSTIEKKKSSREGTIRDKHNKIEAMFVDAIKDREVGSTTDYNDYAISTNYFHWETQNSAHPKSPAGRDYINRTNTMLLFVRKQNRFPDDTSRTMGYSYLGQVKLVKYSGARPMQIVWKLKDPMPAEVYMYAKDCVG